MGAKEILAGRAAVEATVLDKTGIGLASAQAKMRAFAKGAAAIGAGLAGIGASMSALGSSVLAPLGIAAREFAAMGSELHDMSARTGLATDKLSALKYAAEQSGATIGDVELALKNMAKKGLNVNDFDKIAAGIAAIQDPSARAAKALEIFGKSGTKLLPMIAELAELQAKAGRLGLIVDPKDAAAADALGDAFDSLASVLKDTRHELGAAIAEPLTRTIEAVTSMLVAVNAWIENNRGLVVTIAAVASVVTVAGGAIVAMGTACITVGAAVAGLSALITFLAGPVGIAVAVIAGLTTALVLAAGGFLIFTEAGRQMAEDFGTFMEGIFDAIAAGDILNAWHQLAQGMETIWLGVVKAIKEAFWTAAKSIASIMADMLRNCAKVLGVIELFTRQGDLGGQMFRDMATAVTSGTDSMATSSIGSTDAALRESLARLSYLRAQARIKRESQMTGGMDVAATVAQPMRGGAAGTFNAAAAAMLGRAGESAVVREQKKSNTLLDEIKTLLGYIDENTDDLDTGLVFE